METLAEKYWPVPAVRERVRNDRQWEIDRLETEIKSARHDAYFNDDLPYTERVAAARLYLMIEAERDRLDEEYRRLFDPNIDVEAE